MPPLPHGHKNHFSSRMAPAPGSKRSRTVKPKAINSKAKGVSKTFEKKVKKVLAGDEPWGKYVYTSRVHIFQDNRDTWAIAANDENGQVLEFGTPDQYLDAASILWNGKPARVAWENSSGNLSSDTKVQITKSYASLFMKSTSSHVCNVEVYECRPKMLQSNGAFGSAAVSYNGLSGYSKYYDTNTLGGNQMSIYALNSTADEWTQLYSYFKVKKHTVKLIPGESTSLHFSGVSNTTLDLQKCKDNVTIQRYAPKANSMCLFFRIINDISVSSSSSGFNNAGQIYHFPSSVKGGVAIEFKRVYNLRPPQGEYTGGNNVIADPVIVNSLWYKAVGSAIDQQVTFENPQTTAGIDNQ